MQCVPIDAVFSVDENHVVPASEAVPTRLTAQNRWRQSFSLCDDDAYSGPGTYTDTFTFPRPYRGVDRRGALTFVTQPSADHSKPIR